MTRIRKRAASGESTDQAPGAQNDREAASLDLAVSRSSIADQVVFKLLAHIRAGDLKAGDRLPPERELVEQIGVSRPTLREALRALTILGVIRSNRGGGMFVSSLKPEELLGPLQFFLTLEGCSVENLYQARMLIEGGIARHAAQHARSEDIAALRGMIDRQLKAVGDPLAYRSLDVQFHRLISDLARNAFLARIAASMNVIGMEFRTMASETPAVIRRSLKDHAAVVDALEKNDAAGADRAMQDHMRHVLESTGRTGLKKDGRSK
jgi:GntR family transcriptional regulator, transcriptional repressor for pyruvate dehydrogenase complex